MKGIKYFKYIGAIFGYIVAKTHGAILGFLIGTLLDSMHLSMNDEESEGFVSKNSGTDFSVSLLILCAAVMKADGRVLKGELNHVKDFFKLQFGAETTEKRMILLRDLLKEEIVVEDVCYKIRSHIEQSSLLQMLHFLFGLAASDGEVVAEELAVLKRIADALRITQDEFESIQAMFSRYTVKDIAWAYKILETTDAATNDELKKSYRQMAIKYHPDKVANLGEEYATNATEKFKKVQEAWEAIKKKRNIV